MADLENLDPSDIFDRSVEAAQAFFEPILDNVYDYLTKNPSLQKLVPTKDGYNTWWKSLSKEEQAQIIGGDDKSVTTRGDVLTGGKSSTSTKEEIDKYQAEQQQLENSTSVTEERKTIIEESKKIDDLKRKQQSLEDHKYFSVDVYRDDETLMSLYNRERVQTTTSFGLQMLPDPFQIEREAQERFGVEDVRHMTVGEYIKLKRQERDKAIAESQDKIKELKQSEKNNVSDVTKKIDELTATDPELIKSQQSITNAVASAVKNRNAPIATDQTESPADGTTSTYTGDSGRTLKGYKDMFIGGDTMFYNQNDISTGSSGFDSSSVFDLSKLDNVTVPDGGNQDLGSYVKQFESGKRGCEAIGRDSTGGTSFGTYQFAVRVGAFKEFLDWAGKNGGEFGKTLRDKFYELGQTNWDTGKNGPAAKLWKEFAKHDEGKSLSSLEHQYIQAYYYDRALNKLNSPDLKRLVSSDRGLKEALWSTAVQHGPGDGSNGASGIFNKTYQEGMTSAQWLEAIYAKRSTQFSKCTPSERAAVIDRYKRELPLVAALSKQSGGIETAPVTEGLQKDQSLYAEDESESLDTKPSSMAMDSTSSADISNSSYSSGTNTPSSEKIEPPKSVKEAIEQLKSNGIPVYVTLGGGGWKSVSHLNPDLLTRFASAAIDFKNSTGKTISITSAWRSTEDQRKLQGTAGAGKPGRSPHERGAAIDIANEQGSGVKSRGYYRNTIADQFETFAEKYGLWRPYSPRNHKRGGLANEEQHFEVMKGASNVNASGPGDSPTLSTNQASTPGMGDTPNSATYSDVQNNGSRGTGHEGSMMVQKQSTDDNVDLSRGEVKVSGGDGGVTPDAPVTADTASDMLAKTNDQVSTGTSDLAMANRANTSPDIHTSSPVDELHATSALEGDLGILPETKLQTQYLKQLTEIMGDVLAAIRSAKTDSSDQTTPINSSTKLSSNNLSSLFDAYLGNNSPILVALSSMQNNGNESSSAATNTSTYDRSYSTDVTTPIDVRKSSNRDYALI